MLRHILLYVLLTASVLTTGAATVLLSEFGAVPNDGINDLEAIKKACDYCRAHRGTTLVIAPGIYDIEDSLAMKIEREAIGGAYGERVQQRLFRPDAPYVKAFDLTACNGLTILAEGAKLRMNGWYEVVTVDSASNIKISGLSITYHRPPNTVGRVVASDSLSFDIHFDRSFYNHIDSTVTGRVHFYDHKNKRLYTGRVSDKQLIDNRTIRIQSDRHPPIGDYAIIRHGGHYRPAIMIKNSNNVSLCGVSIHSQPGMGIVGHRSSDIFIDGLRVVPEGDRIISTNTDATHFTSCSGKLVIRNSHFAGQGDDCTNIHNYYYRLSAKDPERTAIRIEGADLHALSPDYPEPGDSVAIVSRQNLSVAGLYVVKDVDTSGEIIVTLDKALPKGDLSGMAMTNISRFPHTTIADNRVNSHLARAFLVKSPHTIISGNHITGSTETAIKLGAELGWNESGPVHDIVVENNYISGCGHCGSLSAPTCIIVSSDAPERPGYVNHNITIRNNIFESDRLPAVLIRDASDVRLSGNKSTSEHYVSTDNCHNVTIEQ